jgi:hypothetical protein
VPLSEELIETRLYEILRVCLYLTVQCPDKTKREKFVQVYIENMLTGENKEVILRILYGMEIDINSPDAGDFMDEIDENEDEDGHNNPISELNDEDKFTSEI